MAADWQPVKGEFLILEAAVTGPQTVSLIKMCRETQMIQTHVAREHEYWGRSGQREDFKFLLNTWENADLKMQPCALFARGKYGTACESKHTHRASKYAPAESSTVTGLNELSLSRSLSLCAANTQHSLREISATVMSGFIQH